MTDARHASVPASHRPVLLEEAVTALAVQADGIYLDATFGRGGHSRAILEQLGPRGRLVAIDRDPAAINANTISDARFTLVHAPFSELERALDEQGISTLNGVLFDLGVSSPQLDEPERGFSFMRDGPLDMRMDTTRGESAAEWLAHAEEQQLMEVIRDYGEERFAQSIARAVVAARRVGPIRRTGELAAIVAKAVRTREPGQHPATRTFQAIRIFINQELAQCEIALPRAFARLAVGGRLAVISFHSLEDRMVKQFMRRMSARDALPHDLPVRERDLPPVAAKLVGRAVKAGEAECRANPRARSAILRTLEKVHA